MSFDEIRDIHVLICIIVGWILFVVWFVVVRIFTRIPEASQKLIASSFDIHLSQFRKRLTPLHALHEKHFLAEADRGHHRTQFLFEDETGAPRIRSYKAFCSGTPPYEGPKCNFQLPYSTASRWPLYKLLLHGSVTKCAPFVLCCGGLSVTASWITRNSVAIHDHLEVGFITVEAVTENLYAAAEVQEVLLPLASFILALYIKAKLNWFNTIITTAWQLQGKLADIALTVGCSAAPSNDRAVMAAKYRIYRYLNLAHYFLYHEVAVEYGEDTLDDLEVCNLITEEERCILSGVTRARHTVLVWLGSTLRQLALGERISSDVLSRTMEILREVRHFQDSVAHEIHRVTPISFAIMLQLMVDCVMLLTPPALAHSLASDREGTSVYLWPLLGSMVLAVFYQGGLRLITSLEYPFSSELDSLHPDWLLMRTERNCALLLSEKLPSEMTGVMLLRSCVVEEGKLHSDTLLRKLAQAESTNGEEFDLPGQVGLSSGKANER